MHKNGQVAIVETRGNEDCHIILRGGQEPNYDAASVDAACKELAAAGLGQRLMIDVSHANSRKDYKRQLEVGADVAARIGDAKKVNGNLTVRRAKEGESLLALDGRTYTLDPAICVIADEHGVESLAGIMGGETSGCDENTTDVLIESALWNEINIAQTGRKLGINSDARYRFERGVDPAFMMPGLELATKLVMELCGGTPSENVVVGNAFGEDRVIDFPLAKSSASPGLTFRWPK